MTHRRRRIAVALSFALAACSNGEEPAGPIQSLAADRAITVEGAPGPIRIVTDEHGVRHVYGKGHKTVLFGQGYVAAADRFWQMDMFRRVARGRLSEVLGEPALAMDVDMRTSFMTRDGRFLEEVIVENMRSRDPVVAALGDAYAAGVNAWLADLRAGRNGAELPEEYDFPLVARKIVDIPDWEPEDSMAIARLQAWSLSSEVAGEIDLWRHKIGLPENLFNDVYRLQPPTSAVTLGPGASTGGLVPASGPRPAGLFTAPPRPADKDRLGQVVANLLANAARNPFGGKHLPGYGSNNWMIAGKLTQTGSPLLANDPHLALYNPPVWTMVHLDPTYEGGDGVAVSGVIFPGLPGVILGYNEYIAWGGTVIGYDVTDVFIETVLPGDPPKVVHKGAQVPIIRRNVTFTIKGSGERTIPIDIVPHHGPQVPDPDLDDDIIGIEAGGNMSFAWTGHEATNDMRFLYELNSARNVQDARKALMSFSTGAQNWIIIDRAGDMLYFPYAYVPQRPDGFSWWMPVTGDGSADWLTDAQGERLWLDVADLPQAYNPPEGFLVTANQDTRGELQDGDPTNDGPYLYAFRSVGFRQERILQMVQNLDGNSHSGAKITIDDMGRWQTDLESREAAYFIPHLEAAAEIRAPDAKAAPLLDRLHAWGNGTTPWRTHAGVDPSEIRDDFDPPAALPDAEAKADAVATSIFYAWLSRLVSNTLDDDFEDTGFETPRGAGATTALLHLLGHVDSDDLSRVIATAGPDGESTLWDDRRTAVTEARADILIASLEQAAEDLADLFDSDEFDDWLWGKIHFVRLQHFFEVGDLTNDWSLGGKRPIPHSGGRDTVSPANFGIGGALTEIYATTGASQRLLVEMTPEGPVAWNNVPGGQNGDGRNPENGRADYDTIHPETSYGDWLPGWVRGERFLLRFTAPDVAAGAREVWDIQ